MVKRKRKIVKSGVRFNYHKENHSLNDLTNGYVLFTYYNSQDKSNTLKNIKLELTDTNYNKVSSLLNTNSKLSSLSSVLSSFNKFKIFCKEKSSLFNTQSYVIQKRKINENHMLLNSAIDKIKDDNIKLKDKIRYMKQNKRELNVVNNVIK